MKKTKLLVAALSALLAVPAMAAEEAAESPVKANVSLVNNYLLRGISQTGGKPAVQGGFDYEHHSGFYAGVWGSNVSILGDMGVATNASLELDTYLGFKNKFAKDFTYDVGFLRYNLPGTYIPGATTGDTNEFYGSIGWKWVAVKYSYSTGNTFGIGQASGSNYAEINANYPVADTGVSVSAHYGKQTFKGAIANLEKANGRDPSYSDYKVGVSYNLNEYVFGLAYSKTNAATGPGKFYNVGGKDLGKGAAIVSVTHTF
jgi:uncharacterized protein (TIGR02001 family)